MERGLDALGLAGQHARTERKRTGREGGSEQANKSIRGFAETEMWVRRTELE